MSQQLISHSPDLKKLRDYGYEIEIIGGYLLAHHIPYVNGNKEIMFGTLVSELTLISATRTVKPTTHVINFIGEHPCHKDGTIITAIQHTSNTHSLCEGVIVNHSFSNKPPNGYEDYFQKICRYAEIISAPAKSLNRNVTEKTFKVIAGEALENNFHYIDTNSSRAQILDLNSKFKRQTIGVIGLGGTGAYILDLVAKVAVKEIHLFDGDQFLQHNAFRSPGAASIEQLERQLFKADYYNEIYSCMNKKIESHPYYITEDNIDILKTMSFVFICVDKNSVRKSIIEFLLNAQIPFIDVGLGINTVDDTLIGTVRVTTATQARIDHLEKRISFEDVDDNEYSTNIQIADLNALNAVLAVIKWKKIAGFYQDLKEEHHSTYSINTSQLRNEDFGTPIC